MVDGLVGTIAALDTALVDSPTRTVTISPIPSKAQLTAVWCAPCQAEAFQPLIHGLAFGFTLGMFSSPFGKTAGLLATETPFAVKPLPLVRLLRLWHG